MYKELHIEYSSPTNSCDPLKLRYTLLDNPISKKWVKKLEQVIDIIPIDSPKRFEGFDDFEVERKNAINDINFCIDTINEYSCGFITKRIEDVIEQDTLNYLHHIFEVYHGFLEKTHDFFLTAPKHVQKALSDLNTQVHRCEALIDDKRRLPLPTHMVTFNQLDKDDTLEIDDYNYFTDFYEFGTIYLNYVEIGKTLQDLAIDDDHYIGADAYRPFRHYSADFIVRFFAISAKTVQKYRIMYKSHYDKNIEFYTSKNLPYSHPYNRPGSPPVAKLNGYAFDVVSEIKQRQFVTKLELV